MAVTTGETSISSSVGINASCLSYIEPMSIIAIRFCGGQADLCWLTQDTAGQSPAAEGLLSRI